MNISNANIITNLEVTGCTVRHITHCLQTKSGHRILSHSHFGPKVSRGTVEIITKNGLFLAQFKESGNWVQTLEFIKEEA